MRDSTVSDFVPDFVFGQESNSLGVHSRKRLLILSWNGGLVTDSLTIPWPISLHSLVECKVVLIIKFLHHVDAIRGSRYQIVTFEV